MITDTQVPRYNLILKQGTRWNVYPLSMVSNDNHSALQCIEECGMEIRQSTRKECEMGIRQSTR